MLYLEDYLEMIEQLPMDLRERFTEMREMDLQVQNAMDNLDERVKTYFNGAKNAKPDTKTYDSVKEDYYKVLEDCDEKVQLANQVYDLVDRYLRKLDQELNKFKMELEADNAGITEVLERRSLELDTPHKQLQLPSRGEKRKKESENQHDRKTQLENALDILTDSPSDALTMRSGTQLPKGGSSLSEGRESGLLQPALLYSLGHVGAGSNAIALAAAQAVSNTLQMQQGRRTASLKASYEALKAGSFSGLGAVSGNHTSSTPSTSSSGTPTTVTTTESTSTASVSSRNRGHRNHSRASTPSVTTTQAEATVSTQPLADLLTENIQEESVPPAPEWTYDPNEPRYCVCNQVSYGEMVGCDNSNCPIEWFHYGCVGITNPPKGKWFCPQCTVAMKRREKKDSKK